MKKVLGQLKTCVSPFTENPKVRKWLWLGAAGLLIFQLYFVRELLAAELLFGLGFAFLLLLGGIFYMVGTIGERGLDFGETAVRVIADSARRGYSGLEELSRKPFRHPRSESAQ